MTTSRANIPLAEQGPWERLVPPELNELLDEHTPGPRNRNFRLAVRQAWARSRATGEDVFVEFSSETQRQVMERVTEMSRGGK